jgi:hypothetical protein
MKKTLALLLLFTCFFNSYLFSQDFVVPANYRLEAKEDYSPYEKDVIAAAKWLETISFNTESEKVSEVTAFVIKWISGSPTVNVGIYPIVMDLESKNKGMLVLYMAACARYSLENNYSKNMQAQQKAAILSMINAYKTANGIKKDKKMDKLIKANDEGKLDDWLQQNFKSN